MPSPRNPTTWPRLRRARMMRSFWFGSISANTSVLSARWASARSPSCRNSGPVTISGDAMPTWRARWTATRGLSPVISLNLMPAAAK